MHESIYTAKKANYVYCANLLMHVKKIVCTKSHSILGQNYELLTSYQKEILVERFQASPYLEKKEIPQLSRSLDISEAKLLKWFNHRRAKEREKGLLGKYFQ